MKRFYKLLVLAFIASLASTASAYDFMAGGLAYNINADGNSVTVTYENSSSPRYTNASGSLTIPSTVTYSGKTYTVTAIAQSAFDGCSGFTGSLNIPNSVTSIGDYAFLYCSGFTGSLTIPNSVTSIGEGAFERCSGFTSVNIPNSVTEIGQSSFSGCSGLTQLELGSGLKDIGSGAFSDCPSIAHIICHRDRPAVIADESAFNTSIYSTATVHVPKGSLQSYYAAPVWMKFDNYTDDAAVEEAVKGDLNGDGLGGHRRPERPRQHHGTQGIT